MSIYVELLNLATRTLTEHPDLPEICSVDVSNWSTEGPRVSMHLRSSGDAVAIAQWATALGTVIRLRNEGGHVHTSAEHTSNGTALEVWTHLTPHRARGLLALAGGKFNRSGRAYVDPAQWSAAAIGSATDSSAVA